MTIKELGVLLHKYNVFDALQFISGTQVAVDTANYCKNILEELRLQVQKSTEEWEDAIADKIEDGKKKGNQWIGISDFPDYSVSIGDVKVSNLFFQDMMIRTFYQNCRNAFDILAQAANSACLAFKAKRIETVDFQKMHSVFQQQTYQQAFPDMNKWFEDVATAPEFRYIDAYCNRTKHTCSLPTTFTVPVLSENNNATIPAFSRNDGKSTTQNTSKDVATHVHEAFDFLTTKYHDFMITMKQEITKNTFTNNRYYAVKVYQQKYQHDTANSFSMAYIIASTDIKNMPDEIQILFAKEESNEDNSSEILAANCPFNTIYIRDKDSTNIRYVGKYIADDSISEDNLLHFRKYKKIIPTQSDLPLFVQAARDAEQHGRFYHFNRYFDITTISDDDDFLKRVQLPF